MPGFHLRATMLPHGDGPTDVWIRHGRFTFVPAHDAEELFGEPAFALPGLVDAHAHIAMPMGGARPGPTAAATIEANLEANLRAGVTALRDPGSPDGSTIAYQGRGGFPRLQAAGRFLAPEGRGQPVSEWTDAAGLPAAAAAHARAGAKWVKIIADWARWDKELGRRVVPANYDEKAIKAAVNAAHAAGARVAAHCQGDAAAACVAAGVDSLEHGDGLTDELLARMAQKGIAWTPTLAMTEALAMIVGRDEPQRRQFANERYDTYRALLPVAARHGVTILAGTDMLPHGSVALELDALVRHGLDPRAALGAASTGARSFLGLPNIVEGAPADAVLYTADPRNDPEILKTPALVMLGGTVRHRAA